MSRNENPPFPLGATFFGGDTTQIETTGASALALEGMEWEFEDLDLSTSIGAPPARTQRRKRMRVVRNISGINLLPKRFVKFSTAGTNTGDFGGRVDGYSMFAGQGYPVDEFLPAAGVVNNDLFWICVDGPAKVTSATPAPNIPVGAATISDALGYAQARELDQIVSSGTPPTTNNALVPAPTVAPVVNVTGHAATGGTLVAGVYYCVYTWVTAGGESVPSPESAPFTVAAGNEPQVTLPTKPSGVTSMSFYLTLANGASGSEVRYATGITGTTTNLDTANSGTVVPPTVSTDTIATPTTAVTLSATGGGTTGGSLQAGVYYVNYTLFTALGETAVATESATMTVSQGNIPAATFPALPAGSVGRRIYLTQPGGAAGSEVFYLETSADTVVNLLEPVPQPQYTIFQMINNTLGHAMQAVTQAATDFVITVFRR